LNSERTCCVRISSDSAGTTSTECETACGRGSVQKWTRVIVEGNGNVGSISTRPEGSVRWIEHFYLERGRQGAGIGGNVLRSVLAEPWGGATRLNVLQGSPARRLYERHGFVTDIEDDVDVFMTLSPSR